MKALRNALAATIAAGLFLTLATAQGRNDYTIDLPSGWEAHTYRDGATIERKEYVYGDRSDALMKVKRLRVSPGEAVEAVAEREADSSLRFQPGFVPGRSEQFGGGGHQGVLVQFDFTRAGKPMIGRYYYLRGDESTVWVLQFTGARDVLGRIRNVTDQMARSFQAR